MLVESLPSTVLLVPGFVGFIALSHLREVLRLKTFFLTAAAVLLGLSVYLALPLQYATGAAFNYAGSYDAAGSFHPVELLGLQGLWWPISERSFSGQVFAYSTSELWGEVGRYGVHLWTDFAAVGIGPGLLGAHWLGRRDRPVRRSGSRQLISGCSGGHFGEIETESKAVDGQFLCPLTMTTDVPLPSGTVTFFFTDIEGSTRLWEEQPESMKSALARHDALLSQVSEANNGHVFKTVGDAFFVAFASPADAVLASIESQRVLQRQSWGETPIKVRMALHTGEAEARDGDYFGQPLNRTARLVSAGHGGQILVSAATQALVHDRLPSGVTLTDMGERRLKDLVQPEHIFQLATKELPADFPPLKTLDFFRHNLPLQLTSFVGRAREIAEVEKLLATTRLLTLTGSGGIGKSRLSLQVAAEMLDEFIDGVWFVELASVADPALVPKTVLNALKLREEESRPALQVLTDFLQVKRALLILDNCEHLIRSSAQIVDELLRACPHLKILANSRESLGIAGETIITVPSLTVPDQGEKFSIAELSQYESVRLFVERATTVMPAFSVTEENASALARVCQRLDGIPLAIELAAARVNVLKVEQIAARLDDAFTLLTGGSRTALPRQQTLRALIDWSHDLLSESEKMLLRRLSVFVGGWTLASAEEVCAGEDIEPGQVLNLLSDLVGKSLVSSKREPGEEARYGLLETIRQYAREKLVASSESENVRQRHLEHFLNLMERAYPRTYSAEQKQWFDRLESEHDNLQAALARCLADRRNAETGLLLAGKLARFWWAHGYLQVGQDWLQKVLDFSETTATTRAKVKARWSLGLLSALQGDLAFARDRVEQALKEGREIDDKRGNITSWVLLGLINYYQRSDPASARSYVEKSLSLSRSGDYKWERAEAFHILGHLAILESNHEQSRAYFQESVNLLRELGDWLSLSHPLNDLGRYALQRGDYTAARALFEESLTISRELGARWGEGISLTDLGKVALSQEDYEGAISYLRESLLLAQDIGDKLRTVECLAYLGYTARAKGEVRKFARLLGAVESLRESLSYPLSPLEQSVHESIMAEAHAQYDEATLSSWWEDGRRLTMAQAIALALAES